MSAHSLDNAPKSQQARAARRAEYTGAVGQIAKLAAGRTCGGCQHSRGDYCAVRKLDGNAIEIHTPEAVACDAWAAVGMVKRGRGARP